MNHRFRLSKASRERIEEFNTQPTSQVVPDGPFECAFRTDIGKVRRANQDTVVQGERLLGVADGMGGHQGGETASAEARDAILAAVEGKTPAEETLREAVQAANSAVLAHARRDQALSGMGTTVTVIWLGDREVYMAHCGDSRCYRLSGGVFRQCSRDHSMVMEMVESGLITKEEAATHPWRNIITRAVGTEENVEVDTAAFPRERGDIWLMCSDGLHGLVREEDMAEILRTTPNLRDAADRLINAALDAGGTDNVTVALLRDNTGASGEGQA